MQSRRKIGELERQALKYNGVVMGRMKLTDAIRILPDASGVPQMLESGPSAKGLSFAQVDAVRAFVE